MDELWGGLNEQQLNAMVATEGNIRIIAGAGSGKTRTLTHRFGYLVKAAGIQPGNILCVTFTNKAAKEMKKRVRQLIGDGCDSSLITTYHGFCVRVLRDDIYRLLYPKTFAIISEIEQRQILSEIYGEMDIKMDKATFENIMACLHRVKSDETYVDLMLSNHIEKVVIPPADSCTPIAPIETDIVKKYLQKQKKIFALDFDDLIAFTFTIFERFPEVRQKWAEQLYYIQVDEFQDSSKRELRLIRYLCENHGNLFVVGDPDQNIYEWRGADMAILVDFDKLFADTQTIMLNQNYRSTGNILKAANVLIAHNKNRIPKDLFTLGPQGDNVIHLHAKSEQEEGRWITREIKRLIHEEKYAYRDIAILYRASFLSRYIEQALLSAGIPYEIYGSVRFYDRMEIRDILSYLKLVLRDDDLAFERIINTPRRGFGKAKLSTLKRIADDENLSLYQALKNHLSEVPRAQSEISNFIQLIERLRAQAETMPVSELLQQVITESGYEKYIRELGSIERLDNLTEFKRSIWEREQSYGEAYPLSVYLQEVALEMKQETDENPDKVKLMTIHASKGLEFPACFVCGMTEGIFPSGRTIEERAEAGLEEERRLCFVAMTRAMKHLYLTESEGTSENNAHKRPSRFLFDIGEQNYRRIGIIPKDLMDFSVKTPERKKLSARAIGDIVQHPIFGQGKIIKLDMIRRVYDIEFAKGKRPVSMDYDFDAWQNLVERQRQAREELIQNEKKRQSEMNQRTAYIDQPIPASHAPDVDDTIDLAPDAYDFIQPQKPNPPKQRMLFSEPEDTHQETRSTPSDRSCSFPKNTHQKLQSTEQHKRSQNTQNKGYQENAEAYPEDDLFFDEYYLNDCDELSNDDIASDLNQVKEDEISFLEYDEDTQEVDDQEFLDDTLDSDTASEELAPPQADNTATPVKTPSPRTNTKGVPKRRQRGFEKEDWAQPFLGEDNLWKRRDVPHSGWTCEGIVDLGGPYGVCRMCGYQIIRYVHIMKHPNYWRRIGAGCVCAGRMQEDVAQAREREKSFKAWQARRDAFIRKYMQLIQLHQMQSTPIMQNNISIEIISTSHGRYFYRSKGKPSKEYPDLKEVLIAAYNILDPWLMLK